jgi:hypothetical protein
MPLPPSPVPPTPRLLAVALLLGLLAAGCRPEPVGGPTGPSIDLTGTWEVTDETDLPVNRSGQLYAFAADSTLQIYRPRSLGPASSILAVYDLHGDTLIIRSEFDAELLLVDLQGDTLHLAPVGSGRRMTLIRTQDRSPSMPPTSPTAPDTTAPVYDPPGDVAPEDRPR